VSFSEFEANGNFVLFSNDKDIVLADWRTGEVFWTYQEGDSKPSAVYLTDALAVTVTYGDRRVRFWDLVTLTPVAESSRKCHYTWVRNSVVF
jgi:WD40 repeat protein